MSGLNVKTDSVSLISLQLYKNIILCVSKLFTCCLNTKDLMLHENTKNETKGEHELQL